MNFAGYVIKTHLYVGNSCDVTEIMLYNGRKIRIRGPLYTGRHTITPGDLIEYYCRPDSIDFERDQATDECYELSRDWVRQVTDETTIRTFLLGARILGAPNRMSSKVGNLFRASIARARKFIPA